MNRPTPRKSSLAGTNPITSPVPFLPPAEATSPKDKQNHQPQPGKKPYPHKVSFYQDRQDTDRVRGAFLHTTTTPEGARSLSEFIDRAVMTYVQQLERKYNGGEPFPGVRA